MSTSEVSASFDYKKFFPFKEPRKDQNDAINFILDAFLNKNKKFVIMDAATGVGKSAIAVTVARYLNSVDNQGQQLPENESHGAYFLTTQKILQDQYESDFRPPAGRMMSIKSSSNYQCTFHKHNTCSESGSLLRIEPKGTRFWNACINNCVYKKCKKEYLGSLESITNFPYFLTEAVYSKNLSSRNFLVIDEAHNIESNLTSFVEVTVSELFAKNILKIKMPNLATQSEAYSWVKDVYRPSVQVQFAKVIEKLEEVSKSGAIQAEILGISKQLDLISSHIQKIDVFIQNYDASNWVFNVEEGEGRAKRKLEFRAIDVSSYTEQYLYKFGKRVLLMSATILDHKSFCESVGIDPNNSAFIYIASPFSEKNRPIFFVPAGRMGMNYIDETLPKIADRVRELLNVHKNEKGLIHTTTYKIANYLKEALKNEPRLIFHDPENRDDALSKHINSAEPTVLVSPSMTEGVDLKDDLSRFQIICKIPFPYLGDQICIKRKEKWDWWYPMTTAKTIVQSVGRSVRNENDYAVTYLLDSDWEKFFNINRKFFPKSFKDALQ